VRNTDLQHTSSKIFRHKLFSGIGAPYVPSLRSEIRRVKSFWRKIEYTNLARAFLSCMGVAGREKFRKRRSIIEASTSNAWKLILPVMRVKIGNLQVNPRRDFRFTLCRDRHLAPANCELSQVEHI